MKKTSSPVTWGNRAAMAGLFLLPASLQATQLAYEGFDYAVPGTVTGKAGGYGWRGVWATINGNSADTVTGSLVTGAGSPTGFDARSIGNSVNLPNGRRVGRFLDTSATGPFAAYLDGNGRIGKDNTSLYFSFIQQPNGTDVYYEFELHRGDLGDGGRIGGIGNDQGGNNVNLRAPNGTHTIIGPGNTNVNFYVVRIDFKAGNDDVYVYRNPTSLTEPSATLTKLSAADMSFDGFSLGAFANGRTVAHDEIRVGTSWSDVTVPPAAQPAITKQPRAATSSFAGGTVQFVAQASGQPVPTYQWYKGVNPIGGQTTNTLTLTNVQAGDNGAYHLVATNSGGNATTSDAVLTVNTTPAGLMVYEGFDYDTGFGNLATQPGGLGWGAPWTQVDSTGNNVISGSLAAGTNAPNGYDNQSTGNSSMISNGRRDGRLLDTTLGGRLGAAGYIDGNGNVGADGKTLYLSFMQQPDGTSKFFEFELHKANLGDPGRIGGVGNDTDNPTVALRTGATQSLIGPGSTGVNFYVVRIDFKAGNDDVRVYQNPVSATEPGVPTLTKLAASDMSFNGISLAAFVNGRTVKHDEIRIGQNWSDVVFGTSRRNLTWVGDGTTNAWNTTTPNWNDGVSATAFSDGDPVNFTETGSATPAVTVGSTNLSTASINVDTTTKNYTLAGTGTVTSSGGLHKLGTGALTLNAPMSFGSSVIVDGGDLTLGGTSTTAGNLVLNGASGVATFSGATTVSGSLLDSGTGAARHLGGTNNFGGLVTLNGAMDITGTLNLTGGGAAIWFGNLAGANPTITVQPGAVINITGNYNDSMVIGRDGGDCTFIQNGGTITFNPANRGEIFIGASGATPGTTPTYEMNGGTLDMSTKRLALALGGAGTGATGTLDQSGGSILVQQLDMGANFTQGTANYTMDGGSITIGSGGITSTSNLYSIQLGGGTVGAAANWQTPLAMTLTGTNGNTVFDTAAFNITLNGAIDGSGNLVKNGTGTLALNGFNTYTGSTTVNAGTVSGAGSDQSALSVASGAKLAPGSGVGSFFATTVSLASGSTLAMEVDSTSSFSDQLQASGNVSLAGANLTLAEATGGTLPLGTVMSIVQSSGGAITGTFASLPEGATIGAGANAYKIHYAATEVTLTTVAGSPYASWATSKGLDGTPGKEAGFDDDPDHDGVSNGLEWALGGNPLTPDGGSLVTVTGNALNGLTVSFKREEASLGAMTLTLEYDGDLLDLWTEVPITQAGSNEANGVVVTVNQAATPDQVTVTIPASNALGGHLFARLKATIP